MKTVLFLVCVFCLAVSINEISRLETKRISGLVTDQEDKPIAGADVFIYGSKKGTMTDSAGRFDLIIPSSVQKIVFAHSSFESVYYDLEGKLEFTIKMSPREFAGNRDSAVEESGYFTLETKSALSRKKMAAPKPAMSYTESSDVRTEFFMDKEAEIAGVAYEEVIEDLDVPVGEVKSDRDTRAGQLTAGEWNDLNNWEAWNKLIDEADYKEMGEHWGMANEDRISVLVTNQHELPIPDCTVTLKSGGKIIWTSKTDNAGKAELWVEGQIQELSIDVESRENSTTLSKVRRMNSGVNQVSFKEECSAPLKAEVMFVVDATGSMGDEIEFLKSELKDVIDQVESARSEVAFRWGSVFYRDATDDYLTRQSPLTSKTKRVLDFISMQSAGGGGDYPEAVNEGLEEALLQEWSPDAIARIIFLVLDAPPHHDPEVLKDLQSQIAFASAMGIKIIPITASGINRQTEYLMKFMSIKTNGTYVFLTDHSGIGNGHLDPIVKDFEVEKLNDLLIRVIGNYTDPGRCVSQDERDPLFAQIEVFPNPTVDMLQVKVPKGVQKISLTTSSGMLIHSEKISEQCDISLDLSSYVDGMYVVNFHSEDKVHSVKVMKINKA